MPLLHHIIDLLFPPRADERLVRDTSVEGFVAMMKPMLIAGTRPEAVGLLPYAEPLARAAIHEAKYHGNGKAFALLAAALADFLREIDTDNFGNRTSICIVPVPLGAARRKARGFNQVEEVAKRAARELNIPLETKLLMRTRETSTQVGLHREKREANMRGAFGAATPADPSLTYILLDDVITTGATLQAAIDAVKAAGAAHITPVALAH